MTNPILRVPLAPAEALIACVEDGPLADIPVVNCAECGNVCVTGGVKARLRGSSIPKLREFAKVCGLFVRERDGKPWCVVCLRERAQRGKS